MEADQDGRGVWHCIQTQTHNKNTSTCKKTHIEHLLNVGRRI